MSKIKNEPAVVTSVLVALVGAAATLGLIGTDTQDQLVAVITAVVPIIGGLIVRAAVTPNVKVKAATDRTVTVKLKPQFVEPDPAPQPPADAPLNDATLAADTTPDPAQQPEPAPAPAEDPVKAQLKAAIEQVRANSNALNDARAAAASAAVDNAA